MEAAEAEANGETINVVVSESDRAETPESDAGETKEAEVDPTKFSVTVTQEGEGAAIEKGQKIKAHYRGTLLNGKQFDASYDRGQPLDFKVGAG